MRQQEQQNRDKILSPTVVASRGDLTDKLLSTLMDLRDVEAIALARTAVSKPRHDSLTLFLLAILVFGLPWLLERFLGGASGRTLLLVSLISLTIALGSVAWDCKRMKHMQVALLIICGHQLYFLTGLRREPGDVLSGYKQQCSFARDQLGQQSLLGFGMIMKTVDAFLHMTKWISRSFLNFLLAAFRSRITRYDYWDVHIRDHGTITLIDKRELFWGYDITGPISSNAFMPLSRFVHKYLTNK